MGAASVRRPVALPEMAARPGIAALMVTFGARPEDCLCAKSWTPQKKKHMPTPAAQPAASARWFAEMNWRKLEFTCLPRGLGFEDHVSKIMKHGAASVMSIRKGPGERR